MTKTSAQRVGLADRWRPLCPLCREEVDSGERCTNENCDGHGMTVNQLQLWLIATSNPEK
jgi:hypothetical protein